MASGRIKFARVLVIIMLVMLVVLYEFGMAVNLGPNLPQIQPFNYSNAQFNAALNQAGVVAVVHASLGSLLIVLALVTLVASLFSGVRGAQIFGVLGFITILLAAYSGMLFVLSGFQNDGFSHGMATNFILALVFYFLELYVLKPSPRPS